MAKTESTAVNELIELVQSNSSAPPEPSAELFAAPVPAPMSNRPHRMTSPVPALRGAGEVEPLPPRRAPHATSPQLPLSASPVRMSTADPERGNTIPPLSVSASPPSPRITPRASAAAVPPPPRKTPRSTASVPVRASGSDELESAEMRAEREIAQLRARRESSRMRAQRSSSPPPVPQRAATVPPPVPQRAATVPPPVPQRAPSLPPPLPHQRASVQVPVVPAPRTAAQMPAVSAPSIDELPPGSLPRPSLEMPPLSDDSPLPVHLATDESPLPVSRGSSHASPLPVSRGASHASPLPVSRGASHASPLPVRQRTTVPSLPSLPPPTAPIAAPFDRKPFTAVPQQYPVVSRPRTIDATGDVVRADQWFESTAAVSKVDHTEGTAIVNREHVGTIGLLKRLIVPAIVCATIGIAAGGYIAFYSQDDIQPMQTSVASSPSPSARVEMAVSPTPEPAPGVAEAEPPTKAEQVAKAEEAAQAEAAANESMLPAATAAALAGTAAEPAAADTSAAASGPVAAAAADPAAAETAAAPVAAAAPAPESAVATSPSSAPIRQVQTTRGIVKLVDVRIDSKPSGATVMLVDNGKTSFLGSTPLATSLDPSRKYDVIFTLEGRPTQMAPLDPSKTSKLAVTLGSAKSGRSAKKSSRASQAASFGDAIDNKAAASAEAKAVEAKVEKKSVEAKAEKKSVEKTADSKAEKAVERTAEKKTAERGGEGTLMVSSKPPCEILIDGKATGLTTPQRSIALPAGAHKITFINASAGINKTVSVTIHADKPTKLIQNLMK